MTIPWSLINYVLPTSFYYSFVLRVESCDGGNVEKEKSTTTSSAKHLPAVTTPQPSFWGLSYGQSTAKFLPLVLAHPSTPHFANNLLKTKFALQPANGANHLGPASNYGKFKDYFFRLFYLSKYSHRLIVSEP